MCDVIFPESAAFIGLRWSVPFVARNKRIPFGQATASTVSCQASLCVPGVRHHERSVPALGTSGRFLHADAGLPCTAGSGDLVPGTPGTVGVSFVIVQMPDCSLRLACSASVAFAGIPLIQTPNKAARGQSPSPHHPDRRSTCTDFRQSALSSSSEMTNGGGGSSAARRTTVGRQKQGRPRGKAECNGSRRRDGAKERYNFAAERESTAALYARWRAKPGSIIAARCVSQRNRRQCVSVAESVR